MKYSIGDKANDGVIFRIYDGEDFVKGINTIGKEHIWDNKFPGWRTKPVYVIRFNKPVKIVSLEEFEKECKWIKKSFLQQRYDIEVGFRTELSLPESAVVLDKVKS
jgi:hypothetical protein